MLIWNAWALIPSRFPHPSHSFLHSWWELALFVPQTSASLALALPHPYQGSALLPGEKWVTSQLPSWRSLDLFGSVSLSPLSNPSCPRTAARCPNCHRSDWEFMSLLPFSPRDSFVLQQNSIQGIWFTSLGEGSHVSVRCLCPRYGFVVCSIIRKNTTLLFTPPQANAAMMWHTVWFGVIMKHFYKKDH